MLLKARPIPAQLFGNRQQSGRVLVGNVQEHQQGWSPELFGKVVVPFPDQFAERLGESRSDLPDLLVGNCFSNGCKIGKASLCKGRRVR